MPLSAGELVFWVVVTILAVVGAAVLLLRAANGIARLRGRRRLTDADLCAMYDAYGQSPEARSRREAEHFGQTPREDGGSVRAWAACCGAVVAAAVVSVVGFVVAVVR